MNIASVSLVEYECRSLEKLLSRVDVSLERNGWDPSEPPEGQKRIVSSVVEEWEDLSAYLEKVNAPGSRMTSYRMGSLGATCVAFLDQAMPTSLKRILVEFRIAIDLAFPGRYAWLSESSWHCTLRSLDTLES